MKKIMLILTILFLCTILIGCFNSEKSTSESGGGGRVSAF